MFSFSSEDNSPETSKRDQAIQIFLKYYNFVRAVAWRAAPSSFLLDDIAHDSFIEFVKNAEKWDYSGDLRPLLRKITQNVALVHWRKYLRNLPENLRNLGEYLQMESETPEEKQEEYDLEDRLLVLNQCLKKLPDKSRELVESYYQGLQTYPEMARDLKKSRGAVQMAMSRIRSVLKSCIEKKLKLEYSDE